MNEPIKWVSFFSRSGSEIISLATALNRYPDILVTNKKEEDIKKILSDNCKILFLPKNPTLLDYEVLLNNLYKELNLQNPRKETLITLHGFLRILPEGFIENFDHIFNGHPGLITKYPSLKGKDPQEKAFNYKLPTSGCVIHKVTSIVDDGEILSELEADIKNKTLDQIYDELAFVSLSLWTKFIRHNYPAIGSLNNFIEK